MGNTLREVSGFSKIIVTSFTELQRNLRFSRKKRLYILLNYDDFQTSYVELPIDAQELEVRSLYYEMTL